jgi:hypothetical protein
MTGRRRVLLLATTTGYQARSFSEAAAKLGVELLSARDHCCSLDDPWGDHAIAVHFHDDPESLETIVDAAREFPVTGVIAVGDQPTLLAARAASALGLPFHPPEAARASRSKLETRQRLRAAGLPVPDFECVSARADPRVLARRLSYPSVVKPLGLSGSRGVIRADDEGAFVEAFERLRAILAAPDVRVQRDQLHDQVMIESFIEGPEFAVEALMTRGEFRALALFDKPDPLQGPFFEETIYVTPSAWSANEQSRILSGVRAAVLALGLGHGPVHAECRVNAEGVFLLEAAARPIGGLCARALRFDAPDGATASLEELLLRHALGESADGWALAAGASGVMMIPIPVNGVYRGVDGIEEAAATPGVDALIITAKQDQALLRLPEGASYLGFIFARGQSSAEVVSALRAAHGRLRFAIDRPVPVRGRG